MVQRKENGKDGIGLIARDKLMVCRAEILAQNMQQDLAESYTESISISKD